MKAIVVFTGSGPILILTTYASYASPDFIEKLEAKGLNKFIAYEVPVELAKEKYGQHFDVIMKDVEQDEDLRVLDYNGHRVFYNFSFKDLGIPYEHE